MLNRNRRLLLWWSQQKKDVNDVNLQYDNSQSGKHGPLDPPLSAARTVYLVCVLRGWQLELRA